jgi:hypothetical protein
MTRISLSRLSAACVALLMVSFSMPATAFVLITQEEARLYASPAGSLVASMSVPTNALPAIEVVNPQIMAGPVPSPVSIELVFKTQDATVDMSSFRALYGSLKLNITDRIMEKARLTASGLRIENAEIPSGTHRLMLSIADSKGRRTDRELRLQVQ